MGVDEELSQLVASCLWVRRDEIRSQLLKDSYMYKFSHTYLSDFDWRLKVSVCMRECVYEEVLFVIGNCAFVIN